MAEYQTIVTPWQTIFSDLNTSNGLFNVTSPWMNATDVDTVQIWFEVQNSTDATGVIKPGYQTCNVENSLDSPSTITSVNTCTGNGQSYPGDVFDISATTKTKQMVRFGFFFLTSAASLKCARVTSRMKIKKN